MDCFGHSIHGFAHNLAEAAGKNCTNNFWNNTQPSPIDFATDFDDLLGDIPDFASS